MIEKLNGHKSRGIEVTGYVHTVTFSHRFLLFGSKLEFPWDCGTIQSHAETLPFVTFLYCFVLICFYLTYV